MNACDPPVSVLPHKLWRHRHLDGFLCRCWGLLAQCLTSPWLAFFLTSSLDQVPQLPMSSQGPDLLQRPKLCLLKQHD